MSYLLCSRNISSAKKNVDEDTANTPNKPIPITYAQFVWEATAAVNGKDIDEPNNPTRKRIRSIADALCYLAVMMSPKTKPKKNAEVQGITISENEKK
jgi:hypothetical protein